MPSSELRPRLATEIVDAAFQLYRRHFTALVTLSAVIYTPYIILEFVLTGANSIDAADVAVTVVLMGIGWIFGSLAEAAIVLAVSNSYLSGVPDTAGALRATLRRLGTVLLAVMAKWLVIGLGLMAGVLVGVMGAGMVLLASGQASPGAATTVVAVVLSMVAMLFGGLIGLYLFARYFAVSAVVMLEGLGVRASLRRSNELSKGFKRKVFAALGLPMLLFFVLMIVVGTLQALPIPGIIAFLARQLSTVVASPILAVITTLVYYDARIRKEGFDIEVMAAELGSSVTSAAEAQPPVAPA